VEFNVGLGFVLEIRVSIDCRIYALYALVFVFLDRIEVDLELVVVLVNNQFFGREVYDESDWQVIKHVLVT
jgi:hypothetical protein